MARLPFLACAAPILAVIGLTDVAAASEARCVRGDDVVRRVVVEVQDPSQDVPCEVVYWKDTEEPGVRSVLWSAQTDAGFCAQKADELVSRLESGGWSCSTTDGEPRSADSAAEPPAPPPAAPPVAAPSAPADDAEPEVAQTPPPAPSPEMRAALAPQNETAPPSAPATEALPPATALDAIIEQNLTRLNDGVEGTFEAEIAEYGDLDGDGREDGLVFFTYESERLGKARFVAAYLFDGASYTLAATKPLAGSEDNVHSAEIESIEGGVISLRLSILEPGDASCCPSGERRQMLTLRGGQLVEAGSAADPPGRS